MAQVTIMITKIKFKWHSQHLLDIEKKKEKTKL